MEIVGLVALFMASLINSAAPGPCVMVVFGRTASVGLNCGLRVAMGVVAGNAILLGGALLMIVGAIAASDTVFSALKWGGVIILLIMAVKIFRGAGQTPDTAVLNPVNETSSVLTGIMLGLSSPYNLIFFLALLPQYLPLSGISVSGLVAIFVAVLAGASAAMGIVCMLGAGSEKLCSRCAIWFERLAALSLVFFAGMAMASAM
jgi:threonine/homoserine/homoserine lactone efflux protein